MSGCPELEIMFATVMLLYSQEEGGARVQNWHTISLPLGRQIINEICTAVQTIKFWNFILLDKSNYDGIRYVRAEYFLNPLISQARDMSSILPCVFEDWVIANGRYTAQEVIIYVTEPTSTKVSSFRVSASTHTHPRCLLLLSFRIPTPSRILLHSFYRSTHFSLSFRPPLCKRVKYQSPLG